ncbi:MAG: FtsQ-type POTRA domain-containing protein [Gammaproteobacteria bacterium]|jgi:cell division protein FtsQ|nr:FtsQ-type POTRA domain-containing protein [Gammaproteobacteria bacterium]
MARKQAKRRKQKKASRFRMPTIRVGRIVAPLVAVGIVVATYQLTMVMLDRTISSIEISGPFQRVSALQIEEAISDEIDAGFVGADLDSIQQSIIALQWIDQARVARRWPSRISITVTEQVPAAIWGEKGLLNTRGELFVSDAHHIPAELPRLSGPDENSAEVAKRYLEVRDQLIPVGLDLRRVHVDARGSWEMTLANGIEVRLGRRDVSKRTGLFLDVVADIITGRAADIDYVDMRYGNGFTIGWKGGSKTPVSDPQKDGQKMLASRGTE